MTITSNGIDNLSQVNQLLSGKRIGLITNQTGVDKGQKSTIDIVNERYTLCALYAPEHGVRGDVEAGVSISDYVDARTGATVYSLYGETKSFTDKMVEGIEVIVFDIADIGTRYYTYLYTLSYALESAGRHKIPFVVLDRANPINASITGGNILDEQFASFVGKYAIPARTGLTIGEFATYINAEKSFGCDLTVCTCSGYNRDSYLDETDLVFVPPSPNIPTLQTAIVYSGSCLFEGTNLSEGRGTTAPFQQIGALWLKSSEVIAEFAKYDCAGVQLREVYFTPTFSKYKGELCAGIYIHITDRTTFNPFKSMLILLQIIRTMHAEFEWLPPFKQNAPPFIDHLFGSDILREKLGTVDLAANYLDEQTELTASFREYAQKFWLYN